MRADDRQLAALAAQHYATYRGPRRDLRLAGGDLVWAARGIYGEGGAQPDENTMRAYLWAIMRRCLLLNNNWSYSKMWRSFSQPINPAWQRGGKFCSANGKYAGDDMCSEQRLNRRERICGMAWLALPSCIRAAVLSFAAGELPKPVVSLEHRIRLSNWASYPGIETAYPWGVDIGGEWFFEDKRLLVGDVEVVK